MKENKDIEEGYYSNGDSSEVIMYFSQYDFLIETVPGIVYYILDNDKKRND